MPENKPPQPDPQAPDQADPAVLNVDLDKETATEGTPEQNAERPEPTPSEAANAAEAEDILEVEVASDHEIAVEFLDNLVDENGQVDPELKDLADMVQEELTKKHGEGALSEEKMSELKTVVSEFARMISERDKEIFDKHGAIKKEILFAVCESVINGHMTAEEIASYVSHIELRPQAELAATKAESGYDGVLFYSPDKKTIVIAQEAVEQDGVIGNIRLDLRHIINHEISHGITEDKLFYKTNKSRLNTEMNSENPEFSSEIIKAAREVIDAAEELADSQPQHVKLVLKSLKNIEQDYAGLPEAAKQQAGSLENYKAARRVNAAKEIITDYSAIYLQSDGSFKGFAKRCIEMSRGQDFMNFLKKSFGAEQGSADAEVQEKIAKVNTDLSENNLTMEELKAQHPEIAKLFALYEVFYRNIDKLMKEEQSDDDEEEQDPELDLEGGFYDGAAGFGQYDKNSPENKGSSGTWKEVAGLLGAMADEVNITEPLTR